MKISEHRVGKFLVAEHVWDAPVTSSFLPLPPSKNSVDSTMAVTLLFGSSTPEVRNALVRNSGPAARSASGSAGMCRPKLSPATQRCEAELGPAGVKEPTVSIGVLTQPTLSTVNRMECPVVSGQGGF